MSRGTNLDPATDIPDNNDVNSKILLVYEEYSEMMTTQAILQKVGFDVLGISTEYTLSENVLSFNPDVVVAFGRAGKVTTIGAGRRLREMTRWQGKVVLILPAGYKPNPQDFAKIRADMLLEAPVPSLRLMQILGKMLGYDEALLQERLAKHGTDLNHPEEGVGVANTSDEKDELLLVTGHGAHDDHIDVFSGEIGIFQSASRSLKAEIGGDFTIRGHMTSFDPGALHNPLIVGVDHFFQIRIGQNLLR